MEDSCLLVFTSQTVERMQLQGGVSHAWVIDAKRARTCRYLVCSWNSFGEGAQTTEGHEHREAFLVAPITAVERTPETEYANRFDIRFVEFARINKPGVWTGKRNPVFYTSLGDLGIDPDTLAFEPVAAPVVRQGRASDVMPSNSTLSRSSATSLNSAPLPISAAKPRLAAYYGVPIEAIEIVIRG